MEFIYGALGVVVTILLFAAGVFTGWKVREQVYASTRKIYAKELTEKERQQLIEDQTAFSELMGYNIEVAYGLNETPENQFKNGGK